MHLYAHIINLFAMTSFLDIHYGYDAGVIGTIYYYLDANTLVWCQHGIMAYYEAIVIVIL